MGGTQRALHEKDLVIPTIEVMTIPLTALSYDDHVTQMALWATQRETRVVCVSNVHMVTEALSKPEFASLLRTADMATPDGMPLVWLMRRSGRPRQERVAGMDLLPSLCQAAELAGIGVYFLGSTPDVLASIRSRLGRDFPALKVCGMEAPPFRAISETEDIAITNRINTSGAGFVFVALGCPKQEYWMHEHRGRVSAVMVGLGAAFRVYAGLQGRAPRTLRDMGLEWLHRLACEPGRLWRRYLISNTLFLWYLCRTWLGRSRLGDR